MPTVSNVHVSTALSNFAIMYGNHPNAIYELFPVVPVAKESDTFYKFQREELRSIDVERAAGDAAKEFSWSTTTDTYTAKELALAHALPDRVANNADAAVRPRINSVKKLQDVILLKAEKLGSALINATNITNNATPTIKWDGTSPTIEKDVDTAKNSVRNIGREANTIVLPDNVVATVKRDTTVRDLIRYTIPSKELLTNGDLPPVLWNLRVVVATKREDTAKEGQTAVIARVWTDTVIVFYTEEGTSLDSISFGKTFRPRDWLVKTWRDEIRAAELIEASVIEVQKITASDAAYLITDVLA